MPNAASTLAWHDRRLPITGMSWPVTCENSSAGPPSSFFMMPAMSR